MSLPSVVFITGATSGLGKSIAEKFASEGWDIIITGRRRERLDELKKDWTSKYKIKIHTLCFDVRNRDSVSETISNLPDEWKNIDVLINNAGLALGREAMHEGSLDQWEQMIDTNVKGLLYVTKTIAPWMISHKRGTIINIGSIAGREAYAGGNVYSATKFAVDALTKNMRIDFLPYNIRVSQIAPGAVETEFSLVRFGGDERKAKAVYQGFTPLSGEDVAEAAWFIASRPQHVCVQDMLIMPTAQANASTIHRSSQA